VEISIIVAMDEERGIGKRGGLPWRLSADLRRFKQLTMGHHLIMGRKTYVSIGRPLPGRTMILLTRDMEYETRNAEYQILVAHSLVSALSLASNRGETEAFVVGGGQVYAQALPLAGRLYLTQVHTRTGCDVFFPVFELEEWAERERVFHAADEQNEYAFTYRVLERLPGNGPIAGSFSC
jgi:dihydrofolate reductase